MLLSNDILLLHYLPRNTYIDKNSQEGNTTRSKTKYKLLFKEHKELDIYVFFVLNSKSSSCVKERTFCINENDWEERIGKYLEAKNSFIDVQKYIMMTTDEVATKASNTKIGFSYVGKLLQSKFSELNSLINKYTNSATIKTDFKARNILKGIISDDKPDEFIKKFGI